MTETQFDNRGETCLKVTYGVKSKELKQTEDQKIAF